MVRPVQVQALPDLRLWVRFSDGLEGEVNLSHLAGKGVFAAWNDPQFYEQVHVSSAGAIAWSDQIELCPDALYLRITGKKPEEVFHNLRVETAYA